MESEPGSQGPCGAGGPRANGVLSGDTERRIVAATPFGRFGRSADIGKVRVFLASEGRGLDHRRTGSSPAADSGRADASLARLRSFEILDADVPTALTNVARRYGRRS